MNAKYLRFILLLSSFQG